MAAYGSGAAARSIRDECVVMNVDVGGGTSKIAVCADGKVVDIAAVDVGARLVCLEPDGKITRVEDAGRRYGAGARHRSASGRHARRSIRAARMAGLMADKLFEAMRGGAPTAQGVKSAPHRSPHPSRAGRADPVLRRRVGVHLRQRSEEIRRPRPAAGGGNPRPRRSVLPAAGALDRRHPRHRGRRLAIHHPAQRQHDLCRAARRRAAPQRAGDRAGIAARSARPSIPPRWRAPPQAMLKRLDLNGGEQPVAVFVPWQGSATFQRLDAFCRGVVEGLASRAEERPSAGAGRRRRRRRPARHPPARGDEARRIRWCRSTGSNSRSSTTSTSAPCWKAPARCRW